MCQKTDTYTKFFELLGCMDTCTRSFMQRPVHHPSFEWVIQFESVEISLGQVNNKDEKRSSKILGIVSYALKMGVTCVCSLFEYISTISTGLRVCHLTCMYLPKLV